MQWPTATKPEESINQPTCLSNKIVMKGGIRRVGGTGTVSARNGLDKKKTKKN